MEDKSIGDSQITASSVFSTNNAENARLNGDTHWKAHKNKGPHWIQVDFLVSVEISGIQVQGSSDSEEWTTEIKVEYGDTEPLDFINDEGGKERVM